jgi:dienelactone hydrolase
LNAVANIEPASFISSTRRRSAVVAVAVFLMVAMTSITVPAARAGGPTDSAAPDCADWVGNLVSGSPEWLAADAENQRCAAEGRRIVQENPAVAAAAAANTEVGPFFGDPFRAPHRWAGERGSYELTTYTASDGSSWPAALLGPVDEDGGPYPGVLLVCHICGPSPSTTEGVALWYWAAQPLAEAGYVVMYAGVGGNDVGRAQAATEFFTATPKAPTADGEFNPWHARLDRDRLGIVGHSGAAGVALTVGHTDERYDAVVGWDPARSYSLVEVTPRIPTMVQVADYTRDGIEARPEKPVPEPGSRFTFFDTIRAEGIDTMQVAVRASSHLDWTRATELFHGIYGEMVATYYTLAWFDRYLAPSKAAAKNALGRLTASGTDRFDRSADRSSIGAGFFDADQADSADPEAGNVPIEIGGIPVRNLLSFHWDSRYFLNGGKQECEDLRTRCKQR